MKGIKFQFQGINNKIEQLLIKAQSSKSFIFSFKKIVLETLNVFNIFLEESETDASITQAFLQVNQKIKKAVHLHNINAFGDEDSEEENGKYCHVDYQIDQVTVFLNSRKPIQSNLQGRGQFYKFLQQAESREQDLQQILANRNNNNPTGNLKAPKLQRVKSSKKTKVVVDTAFENKQIQTDMNMQAIDNLFNEQNTSKQKNVQSNVKKTKGEQQNDPSINFHQGSITITIVRNQSEAKSKEFANPAKKSKIINSNLKADQNANRPVSNSKLDITDSNFNKQQKQILRKENDNKNSFNSTHSRKGSNFKKNDKKSFIQSNSQRQSEILSKQMRRQQEIQTDPLKELKQLKQVKQLDNLKNSLNRNMKSYSQASSNSDSEGVEGSINIKRGIVKDIENELIGSNFNKSTTQFSRSLQISKDSLDNSHQRNGNFYKNGMTEKLPTLSTYEMRKPNLNKIKIKQGSQHNFSQKVRQSLDDYQKSNSKNILQQQGYKNQKLFRQIKKQGSGLLPSLANSNSLSNSGLLPSLSNTNSPNIGMKSSDRIKMLNTKSNLSSIHEKIKSTNNQENSCQIHQKCDKKNLPKKMQQKQKRVMKQIENLVSDSNYRGKNRRNIQMCIQQIQVLHERQCGKSCIHLARFYQFLKRNNIAHRQQVTMHRKNISFVDQIIV